MSAAFNGKHIFHIGFVSVIFIPTYNLSGENCSQVIAFQNLYACFQLEQSHKCWKNTIHEFMFAYKLTYSFYLLSFAYDILSHYTGV
jgi:hypothetical protein